MSPEGLCSAHRLVRGPVSFFQAEHVLLGSAESTCGLPPALWFSHPMGRVRALPRQQAEGCAAALPIMVHCRGMDMLRGAGSGAQALCSLAVSRGCITRARSWGPALIHRSLPSGALTGLLALAAQPGHPVNSEVLTFRSLLTDYSRQSRLFLSCSLNFFQPLPIAQCQSHCHISRYLLQFLPLPVPRFVRASYGCCKITTHLVA